MPANSASLVLAIKSLLWCKILRAINRLAAHGFQIPWQKRIDKKKRHKKCPWAGIVLQRPDRTRRPSHLRMSSSSLASLPSGDARSEEHTSELQSLRHLVCR